MQVTDGFDGNLRADDTDLYFTGYDGIDRQSQTATSSPAERVAPQQYPFGLSADSIYAVESLGFGTGLILDQMPNAGGDWTRKHALGTGDGPSLVQIIGDRYFVAAHPAYPPGANIIGEDTSKSMLLTGLLSSSAPPLRLVETSTVVDWQFTATWVFWSDHHAIFSRPVPIN